MLSYRHAKFQAPIARMRDAAASVWRAAWSAAGAYKAQSADELAFVAGDAVSFKGDIPAGAGDTHVQHRLSFAAPRPLIEEADNLVATPRGGSWMGGRLYEKYSAGRPGLRMLAGARRPVREVAEGYVIQSEHIDTFGDWMAEYLSPLSHLPNIDAPVYLPAAFARKPYVPRDAARTGIAFTPIDAPILIRKARIVRQRRVIRYWRAQDVDALRRLLRVEPAPPAPRSILYLSRYGEKSEVADRTHPNLLIEEIVRDHGGKVLRTADAGLDDYLAAARSAETVLFDHGSAAYNMIYWRPRRVVEFVSDDWWTNSFLFLANSIGVGDYTIICTDRGDLEQVRARTLAALERQLAKSP